MDIGSVLNARYTLAARIGKGAMGTVYRATDAQTGQDVALKVLAADLTFDVEMIERFRREAEALRQLRHPNIVGFVDTFQHEGQQIIVMEYVPGGSLFQHIKHGPLPIDQAQHIALDLCDALTRAHRLGIIHRDLKPENVLLAEDGSPRLTDLGVARLIGEGTRLTGTGTQVGTPFYMSPEAWQGEHVDAQADIWSLGVVLYEMLAGQVPFGGETMVAVMNKVLTAPLPDIKAIRPGVTPTLVNIIRKMLTRDKAKRYQTIREVALDLERLPSTAPAGPVTMPAAPTVKKPEPGPFKVSPWIWVVAAVFVIGLCLTAGGLGLWFGRESLRQTFISWLAPATPTSAAAPANTATPANPSLPTSTPFSTAPPTVTAGRKLKVGLVPDVGSVQDKSFNQSAWEGVQKAAQEFDLDVKYLEANQPADPETNIDQFAAASYDVIITVGFNLGEVTAAKARQYPNIKFAIVDNAYTPSSGSAACPDTVKDCYTDGGLTNVTSLMFQEDEAGFLAGIVAAGMSRAGVVCTVSGIDVPPVVRYVTGFQSGAKWLRPEIQTLNVYLPSFVDPAQGQEAALGMFAKGCDVVFGVGGLTGNGALLAAKEKGLMAIGVDVDQYYSYPEVRDALLTSAAKNVDVAVYNYLTSVSKGSAKAGVVTANIKNGGVGLAPYHDWDDRIPSTVKAKVTEAIDGFKAGTLKTTGERAASGALKIALLVPLSGAVPTFGTSTRNGALLAVEEWNAKGGVLGKKIEVIVEDSQCEAEPGRNAAVKVIDQDQVHYIIGEVCSKASIPISEIAEARGVVQISPTSTNARVTLNTDNSTKQYVFRACFIDSFQGTAMAKFALGQGYQTAFVMVDPGNSYVRDLAESFIAAFRQGGQIVGQETYHGSTDTDFSAILAKVADSQAEVLYVPDYYPIVNQIGKQAKQRGLTAVMMGGDGWDSSDLDVGALDGGYYSNHYDPSDTRPVVKNWISAYGAAYQGAAPDALATLGYDATNLMLTAIQQAGVDDPAKVKDMLAGIKFDGVTGFLAFDAQHNPIKSMVIMQLKNGQKSYAATVNP